MAYDAVRAQLDKLLGPDRNGPLTAASTAPADYRHSDICKHYLLGFCPNDLYIKHRSEPGSCRREHSERAKSAFEKDVAAGEALREKARWTSALLAECRSIVMDEDRKIRGHARRLQDTYSAPGDLSGLMIQTFDTLKKLGMVSPDAKIRILSEMDDDDDVLADPDANTTAAEKSDSRKAAESSNSEDKQPPKAPVRDDSSDDDSDSALSKGKRLDDDSDDDDDFGLIKVIPAEGSSTLDGHSKSDGELMSGRGDSGTQEPAAPSLSKAADDGGKKPDVATPARIQPKGPDSDEENEHGLTEDRAEESAQRAASSNGVNDVAGKDSPRDRGEMRTETEDVNQGQTGVVSALRGATQQESPAAIMDKFYESGVGPDGLLMLDRKQSLRVCACCGGYISLVDAESRLLSHYGGKSHHSLAQLRSKIPELEAQLAAEPRPPPEPPRERPRGYPDDREPRWSRREDDRYRSRDRPGRYSDRYGDRHPDRYGDRHGDRHGGRSRRESQRGYGTADWYHNSMNDRDSVYDRRRGDERPRYDHRQNGRYGSGRKRYRSPSPSRGSRRSRHHY